MKNIELTDRELGIIAESLLMFKYDVKLCKKEEDEIIKLYQKVFDKRAEK